MALKLLVSDVSGVIIPDAYHIVARIDDKREERSALITVYTYNSQLDRENGNPPIPGIGIKTFELRNGNYETYMSITSINAAGVNHVMNCYEFLKTLPAFESAIDC